MYFVRAPELRRISAQGNKTFLFRETMSWLDVGLAAQKRAVWTPECAVAQEANLARDAPPDTGDMRFYVEYAPRDQPCRRAINGTELPTKRAHAVAGVVTIDEVSATLVCLSVGGHPKLCRVLVRGRCIDTEMPAYMQEVVLLRAIQELREWLQRVDRRCLRRVTMRVGSGELSYKMKHGFANYRQGIASYTRQQREK